jgi:hypothetical protein
MRWFRNLGEIEKRRHFKKIALRGSQNHLNWSRPCDHKKTFNSKVTHCQIHRDHVETSSGIAEDVISINVTKLANDVHAIDPTSINKI